MEPSGVTIFNAVVEFTQKNLNETALEYFHSRQWSDNVISKWRLGFFPQNKNSELFSVLAKYKFTKEQLQDLYIMNDKGRTLFYNRVIFPIWDAHGKLVAISGRTLQNDIKPKYFNTAYDKGENLYGLHLAIPHIRKQNLALVHEGYADIVTTHAFGIENTVGACGTAFTKDHYSLLSRYTENICFVFDNDSGGRSALARFNKRYEEVFSKLDRAWLLKTKQRDVNIYCAVLQGAKDPDEYLKKFGKEKYLESIQSQMNDKIYQTKLRKILPKVDDKNGKKRSVEGRIC